MINTTSEERLELIKQNLLILQKRAQFYELNDFLLPAQEALKILEDIQNEKISS